MMNWRSGQPYGYVDGNPVRRTDPRGLYSVENFDDPQAQLINQAIKKVWDMLNHPAACCGAKYHDVIEVMKNYLSSPRSHHRLRPVTTTGDVWENKPILANTESEDRLQRVRTCVWLPCRHDASRNFTLRLDDRLRKQRHPAERIWNGKRLQGLPVTSPLSAVSPRA